MEEETLTVCYFGTYREEYSRNKIMIKGLIMNNIRVIECHETLWADTNDRIQAVKTGWFNLSLWKRIFKTYASLLKKYKSIGHYDLMVIGYPGQFDVFLGRLLTWIRRKKLVWDVFMSIYLISIERGLGTQNSIGVTLLKWLETIGLRLPNQLIIDTRHYANWFSTVYNLSQEKFFLIPTGADDEIFHPINMDKINTKTLHLIYYGTFIPNHGVPYIIEAVKSLRNLSNEISLLLIGDGPELDMCKKIVNLHKLINVTFLPWISQEQLKNLIAEADIVLGAFGQTPQSLMTIQNKIYEGMAMMKLVLSGDSPAVRDAFINYEEIILCDRNDPNSLAHEITSIVQNRFVIDEISRKAYSKYNQSYSIKANGIRFAGLLTSLIQNKQ